MTTGAVSTGVASLTGWGADDHGAALAAFLVTADLLPPGWPCRDPSESARSFFERAFVARTIPEDALLTGYYEPELDGSAIATARFAPVSYTHLTLPTSDLV